MTNSFLNYNNTTSFSTDYTISNIYSNIITLNTSVLSLNSSWYYTVIIEPGRRLEDIAFQHYNNSNLWDMLYVLNEMDSVFSLPKSDDYIYAVVEDKVNKWLATFPDTNQDMIDSISSDIEAIEVANNVKYQNFKILYPAYVSRFQELLNVQ